MENGNGKPPAPPAVPNPWNPQNGPKRSHSVLRAEQIQSNAVQVSQVSRDSSVSVSNPISTPPLTATSQDVAISRAVQQRQTGETTAPADENDPST